MLPRHHDAKLQETQLLSGNPSRCRPKARLTTLCPKGRKHQLPALLSDGLARSICTHLICSGHLVQRKSVTSPQPTCPAPTQPVPPAGRPTAARVTHFRPHRATTQSQQCRKTHTGLGCQLGANRFACITPFRPSQNPDGWCLPPPWHMTGAQRGWGQGAVTGTTQLSSHRGRNPTGAVLFQAGTVPRHLSVPPFCLHHAWGIGSPAPLPIPPPGEPRAHSGPASLSSVPLSTRALQTPARQQDDAGSAGRREAVAKLRKNSACRAPRAFSSRTRLGGATRV